MREAKEGLTPSLGFGWCWKQGGWLLGREVAGLDLRETAAFPHLSLSTIHVFHQLTPWDEMSPIGASAITPHPSPPASVPRETGLHQRGPWPVPSAPREVQPMAGGGEKWEGRGGGRGWSLNLLACSVKDCRPARSLHRRPLPSPTATLSDSGNHPLGLASLDLGASLFPPSSGVGLSSFHHHSPLE